jgi:sugar phosphate isomerase/epimerase
MLKITGFADEISPDPKVQIATLQSESIKYLEFRGVWEKNVLALSADELKQFRTMLDDAGIRVSAIGSPVGKIQIGEPFGPELDRFKYSLDVAATMGAEYVRIFSYYMPEGDDPADHRDEVLSRMKQKVDAAEGAPLTLFNENEADLYGMTPERCLEIIEHCGGRERLVQCFDPGNFVHGAMNPWDAWQVLEDVTGYFHIKDGTRDPEWHATPAGEGDGCIPRILADAITSKGYDGFLSLEPHLAGGDKTRGFSGPENYKRASVALKKVLDDIGAAYE